MKNILILVSICILSSVVSGTAIAATCAVHCPDGSRPIQDCESTHDPCGGGGGGGAGGGGGGFDPFHLFKKFGEARRDTEHKKGIAFNDEGNRFYKNGEWANAVAAYEKATKKLPDDSVIRQNLANAREALAIAETEQQNQQAELRNQQQAKASAERMHQSIQSLAQSFNVAPPDNVAPATGGLDFIAAIATPACPPSGDPMVVDACNVPSGLPKSWDDAIAGAYRDAPPGVSDRVRKGFQAVADRDWKVAKAWFQDALNRDPDNASLKRLVALAGTTHEPNRQVAPLAAVPEGKLQLPDPDDVLFLFPGVVIRPAPSPDDVYYYVPDLPYNVPSKGYSRMTLKEAHLRQYFDMMMGEPDGFILTIDSAESLELFQE